MLSLVLAFKTGVCYGRYMEVADGLMEGYSFLLNSYINAVTAANIGILKWKDDPPKIAKLQEFKELIAHW